MRAYDELPGLEHLYLEDSWVLAVEETAHELRFVVEAVLTETHAHWRPPRPGEQYCYHRVELVFSRPRSVEWLKRMEGPPAVDASGEVDFGNIDAFRWDASVFELEGDWGAVRVDGEPPSVRDRGAAS
jgi:hypothetical protein